MSIDLTNSLFIDNHAHSLLKRHLEVDVLGFRKPFTESSSLSFLENHVPHSLHYMNMLQQLREIINFDTEEQLIERRQSMSSPQHVNELWDDASIGGLLVDDGYLQNSMMSINELSKICERPIYRILRLEPLFEKLIGECNSLEELETRIEENLAINCDPDSHSSTSRIVGLKTIAAYRGGLPSETEFDSSIVKQSFNREKERADANYRIKSVTSAEPLYHHLLLRAFEFAAKNDLPVQIHAGIGDSDLVLHQSNPTVMTPIIKDKRFAACRFVFLHCYPYHRETSYLCSVFPNCYMDLSLSVILLSAFSKNVLRETMAVAPASKILAGSDGHSVPEMHWYGAVVFKHALQAVLNDLLEENYLNKSSANSVAELILYKNCRELYQLEGLL